MILLTPLSLAAQIPPPSPLLVELGLGFHSVSGNPGVGVRIGPTLEHKRFRFGVNLLEISFIGEAAEGPHFVRRRHLEGPIRCFDDRNGTSTIADPRHCEEARIILGGSADVLYELGPGVPLAVGTGARIAAPRTPYAVVIGRLGDRMRRHTFLRATLSPDFLTFEVAFAFAK